MDLDDSFKKLAKTKALQRMDQEELLRLYSDLYLNLSPELADHILTVAGSSVAKFRKIQNKMLSNRWPDESLPDFLKLSENGLGIITQFTIRYPDDSLDWLPSIILVIGELSDEEITEAEILAYRIATKQSEVMKYNDLFYDYVRLYGHERPLIAAIVTVRYKDEVLEAADSILTDEFDTDDLSVSKLVSVCDFLSKGGSEETPVHWMLEVSEANP